jgi:predicted lactoylglutathione lyase
MATAQSQTQTPTTPTQGQTRASPGPARPRKLFLNLPVRDLKRSMDFFERLGFQFNPQFTNDQGACMLVGEDAYAMLLTEPFFRSFTKRDIADTARVSEGLYAISCESRAEVDELVKTALANGGKPAMEPQDQGFMYGWSFYDLDGHHWEVFWMDSKAIPA